MPALKGNATLPSSPLVGRQRDITAITGLVSDGARLVTIVGPGGIGKTRLVRELLAVQAAAFSAHGGGGAWFVDATHARTVPELCAQIAATLQLRAVDGPDPVAAISRALRRLDRVLVGLDNLEQLGDHARAAVALWLQAAPAAQLLVTTRVAPAIHDQHVWPLDPLGSRDAEQLFVARVRAIHPHLELEGAVATAVAEIVRRVDGVPLAIELAAARAKVLTLAQILERLGDSLRLLVRPHDEGRHSSMRRTIADSVSVLPEWVRPAVAALGVFAGDVELDAMTQVLASTGIDAALALETLCDHGLIVRALDDGAWTGRFLAFEPVRQFARELADEQGAASVFAVAHAQWYAAWARALIPTWATDPDAARALVARHLDNVVAAVRITASAELVLAIDPHLAVLGQHRRRIELLAAVPSADPREAELRLARGSARRELGEVEAAATEWERIEAGPAAPRVAALAMARRAELVEIDGRTDEAQAMLRRALAMIVSPRDAADRVAEAEIHARLAHALRREGQLAEANTAASVALALFAEGQQRDGMAAMLYEVAVIAMFRGHAAASERGFAESLTLATEIGARMQAAASRLGLGILAQARGDFDRALGLLAESAREFRDLGHLHREGSALYSLAAAYLERGDVPQALIVHGQAVNCIDAVGAARYQALLAALAALVRIRLGDPTSARAALTAAEAAEARCRRERSLRAVLDIVRLRLDDGDPMPAIRALAASVPGDDPQLFARLVAVDQVTAPRGRWLRITAAGDVELGDRATPIGIARRLPLRRILGALAERRIAAPGEAVSLDALVAAGWPGERIRPDAAINRIHVALSTLRRLGLRDAILSAEHGYMFDPAITVELA